MLTTAQQRFFCTFLVLVVTFTGCRQTATQRLIGTWVGRPAKLENGGTTDLSEIDVQVTLQLDPAGQLSMWINDNQERLSGTWEVLEAQAGQVRLQLAALRGNPEPGEQEVRNFELEMDESEDSFLLNEEGADPKFGLLRFERNKSPQPASS